MVRFLVLRVVADALEIVWADGERAVGALPFEPGIRRDFVGNEMRRRTLHLLHELRNGHAGVKANDDVDVIFNPPDSQRLTAKLTAFGGNARVDRTFDRRRDERLPVPSSPDVVDVQKGAGRGHCRLMMRNGK